MVYLVFQSVYCFVCIWKFAHSHHYYLQRLCSSNMALGFMLKFPRCKSSKPHDTSCELWYGLFRKHKSHLWGGKLTRFAHLLTREAEEVSSNSFVLTVGVFLLAQIWFLKWSRLVWLPYCGSHQSTFTNTHLFHLLQGCAYQMYRLGAYSGFFALKFTMTEMYLHLFHYLWLNCITHPCIWCACREGLVARSEQISARRRPYEQWWPCIYEALPARLSCYPRQWIPSGYTGGHQLTVVRNGDGKDEKWLLSGSHQSALCVSEQQLR